MQYSKYRRYQCMFSRKLPSRVPQYGVPHRGQQRRRLCRCNAGSIPVISSMGCTLKILCCRGFEGDIHSYKVNLISFTKFYSVLSSQQQLKMIIIFYCTILRRGRSAFILYSAVRMSAEAELLHNSVCVKLSGEILSTVRSPSIILSSPSPWLSR